MKRTYIIAEAGVNHNGSLEMAKALVAAAALARADAIKFQTFQVDQLLIQKAPKADYQLLHTESGESQYEMLKQLALSYEDFMILNNLCRKKNITFLSTPFDLPSLQFLTSQCALPRIKLASGEITNAPLLLQAARSCKPILLSTGMATLSDIEKALQVLAFGYVNQKDETPNAKALLDAYRSPKAKLRLKNKVTLLHCTSAYPAPFEAVNLNALHTLRAAFHLSVGYSDHTLGIEIPIAAVALGASVIEKHFTMDQTLKGPDHQASLTPKVFAEMVAAIRHVEKAMGDGQKIPSLCEWKNRSVACKSLVALCPIRKGEEFTPHNLGMKRPGTGISGIHYWEWLTKAANRDYQENDLIME